MNRVARSEHDLLLVARALVGQVPLGLVLPLIHTPATEPRPTQPRRLGPIRPTAARLLRDTLAVGCVRELVARGGYLPASETIDGSIVSGRLWQRHTSTEVVRALQFSPLSFELLRFIVGGRAIPSATPPTPADELLHYLACDVLPPLRGPLAEQRSTLASPLCRLAFPDAFGAPPQLPPLASWLSAGGALLWAALSSDIARHWVQLFARLTRQSDPDRVIQIVATFDAALKNFVAAADAANRRDLLSPLIFAAWRIVPQGDARAAAARVCRHLDRQALLSKRTAARQALGVFFRAVAAVGRWHEAHKVARHFDDDYPVAQHLLQTWEPYSSLWPRAEGVLRALDSLDGAAD